MVDNSVDPTIIGAFVTLVGLFLAVAKIMLSQASKDRESDRAERIRLAQAIEKMADNSGKNADNMGKLAQYTKEGNEQSAERNGHLGELIVKQGTITKEIADSAVEKIVSTVGVQHVDKQEVAHQHIESKE